MTETPSLEVYKCRAELAVPEGPHSAIVVDARLFLKLLGERDRLIKGLEAVVISAPYGAVGAAKTALETLEGIK